MLPPIARPARIPVAQPVQVTVNVNTSATPQAPTRTATPVNPIWGQLVGTAAKAVGSWMAAQHARPTQQPHVPQQPHDMPIFDDVCGQPEAQQMMDFGTMNSWFNGNMGFDPNQMMMQGFDASGMVGFDAYSGFGGGDAAYG